MTKYLKLRKNKEVVLLGKSLKHKSVQVICTFTPIQGEWAKIPIKKATLYKAFKWYQNKRQEYFNIPKHIDRRLYLVEVSKIKDMDINHMFASWNEMGWEDDISPITLHYEGAGTVQLVSAPIQDGERVCSMYIGPMK